MTSIFLQEYFIGMCDITYVLYSFKFLWFLFDSMCANEIPLCGVCGISTTFMAV